jgi:hypothetical protein
MLLRTNCEKIFHSLSLLVTNSPEYPTLRGEGNRPLYLSRHDIRQAARPSIPGGLIF